MEDKGAKLSLHSIGSLFSDTWRTYQDRFLVLIEIMLLPVLLVTLGYILLALGFPFSIAGGLADLVGWVVFMLATVALIFSLRNGTGMDASYKAAAGMFWPLVWLFILQTIAVLGAMVMFIVPGIWLYVALSIASYIFVIEHRRGIDALRQSKDYIKGYWWAMLGRMLLFGFIAWMIEVLVRSFVAAALGTTAASVALMLVVLFIVPFSAVYNYTLYENFRELKPELATAHTNIGKGFIKTSAIVGIVVPIILLTVLAIRIYPLLQMHAMR
jgi:hypothetical protein